MQNRPKLNYSVYKNRSDGLCYAYFTFGINPADKRKFGPYSTGKATNITIKEIVTSYTWLSLSKVNFEQMLWKTNVKSCFKLHKHCMF